MMGGPSSGASKMKGSAPPVATFEFKTATTTYKESDNKKKEYKPDILMWNRDPTEEEDNTQWIKLTKSFFQNSASYSL